MLTATKKAWQFWWNLADQSNGGKRFEEGMSFKSTLIHISSDIILNYKVIVKIIIAPDENSCRISYALVNQTFQCWGYFRPKHKNTIIFENHLKPVMLVIIGKLSLSSLKWVPICQGFSHFSGLHHFVLAKLASSSIMVDYRCDYLTCNWCLPCSNISMCRSSSVTFLSSIKPSSIYKITTITRQFHVQIDSGLMLL